MSQVVGVYPPAHPDTERIQAFWKSLGIQIELKDWSGQEVVQINDIYVHNFGREVPESLPFSTPHVVQQLSRYDYVNLRTKNATSLVYKFFGELLQSEHIQPHTQSGAAVIITGCPGVQFYIHLLFKIGFTHFVLLHEEDENLEPLCQKLATEIFGAQFELCLYQNLTVNPLMGSALVCCRKFSEAEESYKTLCYLNFLTRDAFIISTQEMENTLTATAKESALRFFVGGEVERFSAISVLDRDWTFSGAPWPERISQKWEAGL